MGSAGARKLLKKLDQNFHTWDSANIGCSTVERRYYAKKITIYKSIQYPKQVCRGIVVGIADIQGKLSLFVMEFQIYLRFCDKPIYKALG